MIRKRTVMILGAGASRDYLLPTAAELRRIIIGEGDPVFLEKMGVLEPHQSQSYGTKEYRNYYRQEMHKVSDPVLQILSKPNANTHSRINEFITEFRKSDLYSVDRFLALNPQFEEIGKLFIARVLLACENFEQLHGFWYQELFNQLISMGDDLPDRRLSIITFNYDRTLQFYLHRCYMASIPTHDSSAAWKWVQRIPFVNVYGNLGDITKPVAATSSDDAYAAAARKILLAKAGQLSGSAYDIESIFESAERWVFIGFGFDPLNLDALGIPHEGANKPGWLSKIGDPGRHVPPRSEIYASRAGLSASSMAYAEARLGKVMWGNPEDRALEFLHSFPLFS